MNFEEREREREEEQEIQLTSSSNLGNAQNDKVIAQSHWEVKNMFDFDNMGFTNTLSTQNAKYLTCADCEQEVTIFTTILPSNLNFTQTLIFNHVAQIN